VLACLAEGENNRAISQRLGIGEGTVRSHVHVLLQKLQVTNRTQAALIWLAARERASPPLGGGGGLAIVNFLSKDMNLFASEIPTKNPFAKIIFIRHSFPSFGRQ